MSYLTSESLSHFLQDKMRDRKKTTGPTHNLRLPTSGVMRKYTFVVCATQGWYFVMVALANSYSQLSNVYSQIRLLTQTLDAYSWLLGIITWCLLSTWNLTWAAQVFTSKHPPPLSLLMTIAGFQWFSLKTLEFSLTLLIFNFSAFNQSANPTGLSSHCHFLAITMVPTMLSVCFSLITCSLTGV